MSEHYFQPLNATSPSPIVVNDSAKFDDDNLNRLPDDNLIAYEFVLPTIVALGIVSNICNLVTLQNAKLQSIPYKYIRAVAVFDLVGLFLVLGACVRIAGKTPPLKYLVVYQAHLELPLLNGFLAASLFTAVALSGERYFLICRPHDAHRCCSAAMRLRVNVSMTLVLALVLHIPMSLEYTVSQVNKTSGYEYARNPSPMITNNKSISKAFHAYGIIREVIRYLAVMALLTLNFVIIRKLRHASKKRKRLRGMKASIETSHTETLLPSEGTKRVPKERQGKSYEENRITLMMIGMSVVYVVGNLPQACLMPFNEDHYKQNLTFQIFRATANLAEINNHCLNFYIFCFTSKDYYTAFFELCRQPKGLFKTISSRMPAMETSIVRRSSPCESAVRRSTLPAPTIPPTPFLVKAPSLQIESMREIFV